MPCRKAGLLILAAAVLCVAAPARSPACEAAGMPPGPFEGYDEFEIARLVIARPGIFDPTLDAVLQWKQGDKTYLAVIAAAEPPDDGAEMCEDCAWPTRLAVLDHGRDGPKVLAAVDFEGVGEDTFISMDGQVFGLSHDLGGPVPFAPDESLIPVVRAWGSIDAEKALLLLYRFTGNGLIAVFERKVYDNRAAEGPDVRGMEAEVKVPPGDGGYARIEVSQTHFRTAKGKRAELDDRRSEVWIFDGNRYVMTGCTEMTEAGTAACKN